MCDKNTIKYDEINFELGKCKDFGIIRAIINARKLPNSS